MRCIKLSLFIVAVLLPAVSLSRAGTPKKFIDSELSGWEGLMEYWTYKDGALVGATPKGLKFNTFLCSKKKYGDFELKFQVRLKNGDGNSGVQIRSKIINEKQFAVGGPQCDIGQVYWGSLYGEHFGGMMKQAPTELVKKILKEKDFNDYSMKVVGDHVTIKLNGETTVDGDFPKMPKEGIIAWQLHTGGPMEVTFKKIQFKDLSSKSQGEKKSSPKKLDSGASTTPEGSSVYEEPARRGLFPNLRARMGRFRR